MDSVTGIVLAGGAGARLGGADKGLHDFRGRPLVEWTLDRLQPQVDTVIISCNRNLDRYASFGHPLVQDRLPPHAGPLAGLAAALSVAPSPLCVSVPCDNPHLPANLVARLAEAHAAHDGQPCVAHDGEREQWLYAILRRDQGRELDLWLDQGGRAAREWYRAAGAVMVDFSDARDAFRNLNLHRDFESP